jgi:hypothetical protein
LPESISEESPETAILKAALLFPDFQKSSAQCWNEAHQLLHSACIVQKKDVRRMFDEYKE